MNLVWQKNIQLSLAYCYRTSSCQDFVFTRSYSCHELIVRIEHTVHKSVIKIEQLNINYIFFYESYSSWCHWRPNPSVSRGDDVKQPTFVVGHDSLISFKKSQWELLCSKGFMLYTDRNLKKKFSHFWHTYLITNSCYNTFLVFKLVFHLIFFVVHSSSSSSFTHLIWKLSISYGALCRMLP